MNMSQDAGGGAKTLISIDFCDFWPGFPKDRNFFTEILRRRYDVRIADKPDFVLYSNYGYEHRIHTCPRIYFTGEPGLPDFRECDYAMTFNYLNDPRHLRLPLYVIYASPGPMMSLTADNPGPLLEPMEAPEVVLRRKTKFCALVIGHANARKRIDFFHRLSRYKSVDSGGRHLNNLGRSIGGTFLDKQAFLQPYKFNIAFENRSIPGYTTEKIYEAFLARCIPIYWGSPRINEEFNPKSFLNLSDFPSEEALVERIKEIDNNPALHLEYLRQPVYPHNRPNEFLSHDRLLDFFEKIFITPIRPVGTRRRIFQLGRWIAVKKHRTAVPEIWSGASNT